MLKRNGGKAVGWYDEMSVLYDSMDKNNRAAGSKDLPVAQQWKGMEEKSP